MGIHGLWEVIESTGRPINVNELTGKIISIDISIWLHQSGKGMKDRQGNNVINAHLVSIFKRISKMIFYGIKPIVVFDGSIPQLKLQTMAIRHDKIKKSILSSEAIEKSRIEKLILKHILNKDSSNNNALANSDIIGSANSSEKDDIYRLALLNEPAINLHEEISEEVIYNGNDYKGIDWTSSDFQFLPDDMKLELLIEARQNSKICPEDQLAQHEDAQDNESFSSFQVKKLMHTSAILKELEKVRTNVRKEAHSSILRNLPKFNNSIAVENMSSYILSAHDSNYALIKGFSGNSNINFELLNSNGDNDLSNTNQDQIKETVKIEDKFLSNISSKTKIESPIKEDNFTKLKNYDSNLLLSEDDEDVDDAISCSNRNVDNIFHDAKNYQDDGFNKKTSDKYYLKILENHNIIENSRHKSTDQTDCIFDDDSHTKFRSDFDETVGTKIDKSIDMKQTSAVNIEEELVAGSELGKLTEQNTIGLNKIPLLWSQQSDEKETSKIIISDARKHQEISEDEYLIGESFSSEEEDESDDDLVEVPASIDVTRQLNNKQIIEDNNAKEAADDEAISANTFRELMDANLSADSLTNDLIELERMRNKHNRNTWTINDQVVDEVKELLLLFGVPFVTSPTESEAQCAFLEHSGQCDGCITEDSDIWAFGGCTVYKDFFNSKKNCCIYKVKDIIAQLGLDRNNIIGLAMLCGCDYTFGISGIGPVKALEVLAYFDGVNLIDNLTKFRDYWQIIQNSKEISCSDHIKNILKKISIPDGFPNAAVYNAFMQPSVDESITQFKWQRPNLDGLRQFAEKNLGWKQSKVDEVILPVLKKFNLFNNGDGKLSRSDSAFCSNNSRNFKQSKRLKLAITKLKNSGVTKRDTSKKTKCAKKRSSQEAAGFLSAPISTNIDLSENSSNEISD